MENVTKVQDQNGKSNIAPDSDTAAAEKLNITLYLASKTISLLGTNIYSFALSLYILKVTGSGTSFALNVLIGMLPKVMLGPFAGILADRVNRKKLTVAFDIFSSLVLFGLLGLSSLWGLKVALIYVVSFVLSTVSVFYDTALTSSLPNLVTDAKLMKINSYTSVSSSLAGILSPVLAGIIYGLVPIRLFLVINGFSFIVSAAAELFIDFELNRARSAVSKTAIALDSIRTELKEVLGFIKNQKVMYSLLKYMLMINFFLSASISVVYPYVINKVMRMSPVQFGIFQGFYFAGMIVCSVIIGNIREKDMTVKSLAVNLGAIGVILVFIGAQTVGFSFFRSEAVLSVYNSLLLFILGIILIAINTPIMVTIQRLTPESLRGRLTGILGTLSGGIIPLGIVLAGLVLDKVHPFLILSVSGGCIIAASAFLFTNKNVKVFG